VPTVNKKWINQVHQNIP